MIVCMGAAAKKELQRLIISSGWDSPKCFTCGFDFTKEEVEKLAQVVRQMKRSLS